MNPELEKLIALQELDIQIKVLEREITDLPRRKSEIESQFNQFAAEYLSGVDQLNSAKHEHQQLEFDLRESEERLEKYKKDLMRVRNEKEYSTVLREIDLTKKSISGLETSTLERIEVIEKLEQEVRALSPQVEVKRTEFDQLLAESLAENERLTGEANELRRHREELVVTLRNDLVGRYNRLVELRDGLALAEVRNGSCTSCFMAVRPQVYSDVRKGDEIITCDNCSRILFYRAAAQVMESETAI